MEENAMNGSQGVHGFNKKIYQIDSELGPLAIELVQFKGYCIIVMSHHKTLMLSINFISFVMLCAMLGQNEPPSTFKML